MGIEKMSLLSVEGPAERLDGALMTCGKSGCFQMTEPQGISALHSESEQNPYSGVYSKLRELASELDIPVHFCGFESVKYETGGDFENYLAQISEKYSALRQQREQTAAALDEHRQTDACVRHLRGLDVSFSELAQLEYVCYRVGRLPEESEKKLAYYKPRCFIFLPFEKTDGYVWGIYLAPKSVIEFSDSLMDSLFFERVILPDYLVDNAEDADRKLSGAIAEEEARLHGIEERLHALTAETADGFSAVMSKLKYKSDCFELRRKAVIADGRFSFSGYCPSRRTGQLEERLTAAEGVVTIEIPIERKHAPADTPVVLKNNIITRPFEMFVKMYGLPSYGGFDPTPYVAFTYMLLFGIMFGDVGQGLLISLLGFILTRFTKNGLAPIMERIGLFSAAFGVVYGSVFGIETLITPFFHRAEIWNGLCRLFSPLGLPERPANIFQAATVLLLFSLAIGIVLILISMIFNMVLKFKSRQLGEALFGVNGAAGVIFYSALVAGAVGTLLFGLELFTPAYILLLIVLPLVAVFFKKPLGMLVTGERPAEKTSVGNFIIENFIELFEAAISFLSNTMSYLRIGGFILSHAGFMLVVSQLAGTNVPNAQVTVGTVVTYIIGNLVVMGVEGLLVGIQVLRLEFYEIFNRFYDGSGQGFSPISISLETEN